MFIEKWYSEAVTTLISKPKNKQLLGGAAIFLSYIFFGLLVTKFSFIKNPITDVVGGSSLFGTNTLEMITWLILSIMYLAVIGLFIKNKNVDEWTFAKKASTKMIVARDYFLIKFRHLKFEQILLTILLGVVLSKYLTEVLIRLFGEKRSDFIPFVSDLLSLEFALIFITLIFFIFTVRAGLRKFGFTGLIAALIPGAVSSILLFSIVDAKMTVTMTNHHSYIRVILGINILFILLFFKVVTSSRSTLTSLTNLGVYAGVFALIAKVPGPVPSLNYFEDYPMLNAHAFRNWEYKPWEDLQLNHGIYFDLIRPLFGTYFIDNSVWGMQVGIASVVFPIEVCITLYLAAKVLGVTRLPLYILLGFIALTRALPTEGINSWFFVYSLPRAIPILFCTYAIKLAIKSDNFRNLSLLSLSTFIAVVWAPENLIIYLLSLVTFLYHVARRSGQSKTLRAGKSLFVAAVPALFTFLSLMSVNLLKPFLADLEGLSSNLLQGALPIDFKLGVTYTFFVIFLPPFFICSAFYYSKKLRVGLDSTELILFPSIILGLYYYIKFLAWPDLHIQQSVNAMFLVWVYSLKKLTDSFEKRTIFYQKLKLVFGFTIILALLGNMAPSRQLHPQLEGERIDIVGIANPALMDDIDSLSALKKEIQKLTNKSDPTVLDLSNAPVSIHLLPGIRFVRDLSFSSFDVAESQQLRALEAIERDPADAVILSGPFGYGRNVFPGEMYQRNYLIAKDLFAKYKHVSRFGKYTLLTKGSLNLNSVTISTLLDEDYKGCNWHKALSFVPTLGNLSKGDLRKIVNINGTGQIISNPVFAHQIKGIFVTVYKNGSYSISTPSGFPYVNFDVVHLGIDKNEGTDIYVPLETCPNWALNGSRVDNLAILGKGAIARMILIE